MLPRNKNKTSFPAIQQFVTQQFVVTCTGLLSEELLSGTRLTSSLASDQLCICDTKTRCSEPDDVKFAFIARLEWHNVCFYVSFMIKEHSSGFMSSRDPSSEEKPHTSRACSEAHGLQNWNFQSDLKP